MEGSRRRDQGQPQPRQPDDGLSGSATVPTEIPKPGWRDILLRTKTAISKDNLSIIAGGTAFFILLGLVPGLAALISIYGLVANPSDIGRQLDSFSRVMPTEVRTVLEGQMTRIASEHHTAGLAAVLGIVLALWGGAAAMKTVMNALNMVYHEDEKRGYVKLTLMALALTFGLIIIGALSVGAIVILPPVLAHVGLGDAAKIAVSILRWPFLLVIALVALALVYRYAPSREKPEWKWVTPGAVVATLIWVAGSALFAVYAQHFGSYNKTYGSLGAVVVLMLWLYISAFALLLGAEINAQSETPTARDTTTGQPEPIGRRGAYVADQAAKSPTA